MTPEEAADVAREVLGDRAAEVLVDEGGLHVTFPVAATDYDDERGAEVGRWVAEWTGEAGERFQPCRLESFPSPEGAKAALAAREQARRAEGYLEEPTFARARAAAGHVTLLPVAEEPAPAEEAEAI